MTTEEMFTKLREEQNKTKYAHHVTTNQIYAATKVSLLVAVFTAILATTFAYHFWQDREVVRLNRAIDKALLLGERLGVSRNREGYLHSDEELLSRIESIVSNPAFSWDNTFKTPGLQYRTIGGLADSGMNRFTELLKERRDGPLALTLNK